MEIKSITVDAAAKKLGTSFNYIYYLLRSGKLVGKKVARHSGTKIWELDPRSVESYKKIMVRRFGKGEG